MSTTDTIDPSGDDAAMHSRSQTVGSATHPEPQNDEPAQASSDRLDPSGGWRDSEIESPALEDASEQTGSVGMKRKSVSEPNTVVVIGASAGGLEAIKELLGNLTARNTAVIIIQHRTPNFESHLVEILARECSYRVVEARAGERIESDTVYVVTPGELSFEDARFVSHVRQGVELPIDAFFRAVAEDRKDHTVGVILSGTGSDGTLGIAAIKEVAGITIAQDNTARFNGMPTSAVASGMIDCVLPPAGIAAELDRIAISPYLSTGDPRASQVIFRNSEDLQMIFQMLRDHSGVDFASYKDTTVKRRIFRRMVLSRIERLDSYVTYLKSNPKELHVLYEDLLINVTNFFRDPETFEALKQLVLPVIANERSPETPLRIWVAGCSTGEEAYSMAITIAEFFGTTPDPQRVQIFATDVSDRVIQVARRGIYPENIAQDVSPERLRKYFKKLESGYQIQSSIRDLCIFARQNMVKDPPFSRLDLISCRNVMIYLGSALQKQLIPTFHQALQPAGFLMLGTSETIGLSADLFQLLDKKNKIYSKKTALKSIPYQFTPVSPRMESKETTPVRPAEEMTGAIDIQREADRIILSKHAPPGVIVDQDMHIVHFRGQTGAFLEPAPGTASLNLLKMVREGLRLEVRTAIEQANTTGVAVRRHAYTTNSDDRPREIVISVTPIRTPGQRQHFTLVLFEEAHNSLLEEGGSLQGEEGQTPEEYMRQIHTLRQELEDTKEFLQRNIEEQDAYNEELKSANEEIQSSNEELQSTNEELETAKEELQSINEELTTLNDELQMRNVELTQVNNDLTNLLANMNFPVVMVGVDLHVRRFNPMAERILNLIPTDIGRSIGDIKPNVRIDDLELLISEVIRNLNGIDREVQDKSGKWYSLSIRPYKTSENKIDGAVVVMIEIDSLKRSLANAEHQQEIVTTLLELVPRSVVVLNANLEVERANHSFLKYFDLHNEQANGCLFFDIERLNRPELRAALRDMVQNGLKSAEVKVTLEEEPGYHLSARRLSPSDGRIVVTIEPLTKS